LFGAHLEELKQNINHITFMTSTSLKRIQQLCKDRAEQLSKSDQQYAHAMAMVYENIELLCEIEIPNEKQMIIDICNECAKDMMQGNIALGKPVGEQLYKKKYQ
jgi:GTP:adenosylcobinamide-phosphate guanylyltransferase